MVSQYEGQGLDAEVMQLLSAYTISRSLVLCTSSTNRPHLTEFMRADTLPFGMVSFRAAPFELNMCMGVCVCVSLSLSPSPSPSRQVAGNFPESTSRPSSWFCTLYRVASCRNRGRGRPCRFALGKAASIPAVSCC